MHLDLQTVCRVFENILNGSMSREQADRWAYAVVQEEETGVVTYSPPRERERIWAGVMYLYGVDTMKAPGEYLHSDDDISAAMDAKLGEVVDRKAAMPDQGPSLRRAAVSRDDGADVRQLVPDVANTCDELGLHEQRRSLAVLDFALSRTNSAGVVSPAEADMSFPP